MPVIDVLLATYNGARFLPEQLDSLDAQEYTDWRLIVRDDGSSDGSLDLVRAWAQRTGRAIMVIEDGRTNLGASGNFAALIEASDAPYFACCDQDDVWLPHKLTRMLEALQIAERAAGTERPMLAYSDLEVVDARLDRIDASFRRYAPLELPRPGRELVDLMTHNVVTGCASLGNAALRRAALPIPPEAVMHDWWLALVAAALGGLVRIDEATVKYRQHGRNTIGAVRTTAHSLAKEFLTDFPAARTRVSAAYAATRCQAGAMLRYFSNQTDPAAVDLVRGFSLLSGTDPVSRLGFSLRHFLKFRRPVRSFILMTLF